MAPRKRSKRKKVEQKLNTTLKDYFSVERTIKKRESQELKEETVAALRDGNGTTSISENLSTIANVKQERKPRLKTLKDFYPVRRSSRKPESEIKKEKLQEIEDTLMSKEERGLQVCNFADKGRGIVAAKSFGRGDFVVEYRGDLVDLNEAKRRESEYERDPDVGCYMYYFQHKNQSYCVDATAETGYLGRLLNHSAKEPNCATRIVELNNRPHLILVAARDIAIGEELLYDYGDRSRHAIEANPWLTKS